MAERLGSLLSFDLVSKPSNNSEGGQQSIYLDFKITFLKFLQHIMYGMNNPELASAKHQIPTSIMQRMVRLNDSHLKNIQRTLDANQRSIRKKAVLRT